MPSRTGSVRLRPAAVALERVHHPQRLLVVAEAAAEALVQQPVERLLAGVPERRMAEVVPEADRLRQVLVQPQGARHRARDAAGLERVREAGAVVVALGRDEDLGLVLEAAEALRVDDPVAVALEGGAQAAGGSSRSRCAGYERVASGESRSISSARIRASKDEATSPSASA